MEWMDYRRVNVDTSILVDKSRGEKLTVVMNLTFPRVPCYRESVSTQSSSFMVQMSSVVVSVDVMDISGELQRDLSHNILKTRLDQSGKQIPNSFTTDLRNDLDKMHDSKSEGYCGSCYGGIEPESGCCNTCEEVRQSYLNRGWSFAQPDLIEQVRSLANSCIGFLSIIAGVGIPCSAKTRIGQRSCTSRPMKDATFLVEFVSTRSSGTSISRLVALSKPTRVTFMNLCHTSRMMPIAMTSRI